MRYSEVLDEIETLVASVRLSVERDLKRSDLSSSDKEEIKAHLSAFLKGMDDALQGDSSLASIVEILDDDHLPFDGSLSYASDEDEEDIEDLSDEDEDVY